MRTKLCPLVLVFLFWCWYYSYCIITQCTCSCLVLDLVVIDPPYGLHKAPWDESPITEESFSLLLQIVDGVNSNENCCFVSFASFELMPIMVRVLQSPACSWQDVTVVAWHKTNAVAQGNQFVKATEYMIFAWRSGKQKGYWDYPSDNVYIRHDIWDEPHIGNAHMLIPGTQIPVNVCQKPAALLRRLVVHHTPPGGFVLDLCAGSHSLMLVCMQEGRHCTSFESDTVQHNAALGYVQAQVAKIGLDIEKAAKRQAAQEKRKVDRVQGEQADLRMLQGHAMFEQQQHEGLLVQDPAIPKNAVCVNCNKAALPQELFYSCLGCKKALHKSCAVKEIIGHTLEEGNYSKGFVCCVDCLGVTGPGVDIAAQRALTLQKKN